LKEAEIPSPMTPSKTATTMLFHQGNLTADGINGL
jgi:hypothetical protein